MYENVGDVITDRGNVNESGKKSKLTNMCDFVPSHMLVKLFVWMH